MNLPNLANEDDAYQVRIAAPVYTVRRPTALPTVDCQGQLVKIEVMTWVSKRRFLNCRLRCSQVDGIQRLATLLQQLTQDRTGAATARVGSIEQARAFLQWLVSEAAALSPDARTEAFWCAPEI